MSKYAFIPLTDNEADTEKTLCNSCGQHFGLNVIMRYVSQGEDYDCLCPSCYQREVGCGYDY